VLVVDGTFNTNSLRLPLLIAVGITNFGKTFPVAFSYCLSESKESYNFFFQSLKEEAFASDIQSLKVSSWRSGTRVDCVLAPQALA
jgi:MULE transposase domain